MALTDITRTEIEQAVKEYDRLGRDDFLTRHGFARARRYLLRHSGRYYDSKAIVGVAHGFLPGQGPLTARDFSGGADHAVRHLRRLGYAVVDDVPERILAHDELIARVSRLRVNRSSGRPALFQPITLLWALSRAMHAEPRLLPWQETEQALTDLLRRHGMRGERPRPDYPVAALHRAGLWELRGLTAPTPAAHGDTELRRWFAEQNPVGGLTESAYDLLRHSVETRLAVIDELLCTFFEDLDYEPLLTDLGLYDEEDEVPGVDTEEGDGRDEDEPASRQPEAWLLAAAHYERLCRIVEHREDEGRERYVSRPRRNPIRSRSARRAVLRRSRGRCENPHCTGQPADVTDKGQPILEVDHIVDLGLGGRDHPSQMVALCPNCHAVKTRGSTRESLRALLLEVAAERHAGALAAVGDPSRVEAGGRARGRDQAFPTPVTSAPGSTGKPTPVSSSDAAHS